MIIEDIYDVSDKYVSGRQLGYKLFMVDMQDLEDTGFPEMNANRERGQLPFKEGAKVPMIQCHRVLQYNSEGAAGDLAMTVTNTVIAIVGDAFRDAVLNLIEEKAGKKFVLVIMHCKTNQMFLLGTPCEPMDWNTFTNQNNNDASALTMTFTSQSFTMPSKYIGTLPRVAPVQVPADSTTLAIVPESNEYVIPSGTAAAVPITAVSGITEADYGRNITLKGAGTQNIATIEDGSVFTLVNGETWEAKQGNVIIMRIVDASHLVEVNGTRVES